MKVAWCTGGGGSRGIVQWGMIKRLMREPSMQPDMVFGTSIGSLNGAGVAMGDLELIEHLWLNVTNKDVHRFAPWQLVMPGKGALYDFGPMRRTLETFCDPQLLRDSKVEFWATVTSLRNNCAQRYRLSGPECHPDPLTILQASCSPPVLVPPVKQELYDGGVSDNYNVSAAIGSKAGHIIMMHPSRPQTWRIKNAFDALDSLISITMWSIYTREIEALALMDPQTRPKFTVIEPAKSLDLPMFDFDFKGHDRRALIKLGYDLAAKAIG